MARARMQVAIVRQHADEDDCAGYGEADAKHQAGRPRPAEHVSDGHAQTRRDDALRHRAGHGDAPDGDELFDVELQPDPEHQQDDADLGQLLGHVTVRHEARRVGSDEEARDKISDDGGEPGTMRGKAEHERRAEAARQGQNQIEGVHRLILVRGSLLATRGSFLGARAFAVVRSVRL